MLQKSGAVNHRDYQITILDVFNIARTIDGLAWQYDEEQAQSVRCFVQASGQNVLHYQEMDADNDVPFQLVVSRPELLELLVQYGHGRALLMDSTFGTNNLKVSSLSHV